MDSLAYLERASRSTLAPVYVLHGDETFLKRQVLAAIRARAFGENADEFSLSTYSGDKADFAAVRSELETLPFLCPRRVVIIENADPFVTRHRQVLEGYVAAPASSGTLVLDVKTWPANTRLAKLVPSDVTLVCKGPAAFKVPDWCVRWAASHYQKQLAPAAARVLVDLVGTDMGLLDQELSKLSTYVGSATRIDTGDVDQLVGRSRGENTFKIFDAIGAGNANEALTLLERLLDQGEDPVRMLGAFSLQLRRLAQAARLVRQGSSIGGALEQVQVPPFARQGCEQQLRHIGNARAERLYDRLLEMDLGMKGGSALGAETLLKRLIVQLARPAPSAVKSMPLIQRV
jgi:DNA polymerase-3 subunit delta